MSLYGADVLSPKNGSATCLCHMKGQGSFKGYPPKKTRRNTEVPNFSMEAFLQLFTPDGNFVAIFMQKYFFKKKWTHLSLSEKKFSSLAPQIWKPLFRSEKNVLLYLEFHMDLITILYNIIHTCWKPATSGKKWNSGICPTVGHSAQEQLSLAPAREEVDRVWVGCGRRWCRNCCSWYIYVYSRIYIYIYIYQATCIQIKLIGILEAPEHFGSFELLA